MIPLTFADVGKEHIIRKVGGNSEVRAHLENLGFVPGAAVTVITTNGGNLIVNVKQQIGATISYPIVHGLVGLSLGNQSLNLISFELEQSEATESEPVHDHYKLQIYNPTEVDIVSDVKLQLVCNGSY